MPSLTPAEEDLVFTLAAELTQTCQSGKYRHDVLVANVRRRIDSTRSKNLEHYLQRALNDDVEYSNLISALTIHTTSWFRELPHFERLRGYLLKGPRSATPHKVNILSVACSTGEEVYSFALVLESYRQLNPGFDYEVHGIDIDPVSIATATRAVYEVSGLKTIPAEYHRFLLAGSGKSAGLFTLSKDIRARCRFSAKNISALSSLGAQRFDAVVCRNVLIYFSPTDVQKIVSDLIDLLAPNGMLCLGHSEAIEPTKFSLSSLGNACYVRGQPTVTVKKESSQSEYSANSPRVLVVDDSPTIQKSMQRLLQNSGLDVATVGSAAEATTYLATHSVDVITLDLQMPGMSGSEWLKLQRSRGMRLPVIILSGASSQEAVEVLGALEEGAQDYLEKSVLHGNKEEIINRILALAIKSHLVSGPRSQREEKVKCERPDVILIGASTGGTQTLTKFLSNLPPNSPPVCVTQHITHSFSRPFAQRLAHVAKLTLGAGVDGEELKPGHLYMALDDVHIGVSDSSGVLRLKVSTADPVNRHRPSVDFLYDSGAALSKKTKVLGILLTGMGADGAKGLARLKEKGHMTFAQDEESSVVFGMPKEAIRLGAALFIGNPEEMREIIDSALQ